MFNEHLFTDLSSEALSAALESARLSRLQTTIVTLVVVIIFLSPPLVRLTY